MRRIDRFLGPPICVVLAALKSIVGWLGKRGDAAPAPEPRKILAIKFWGIGSIVLTTPALRALKNAYPDCQVTFLTFEQNEAVCRMIGSIDRVYPYRADGLAAFLSSFMTLVRFLRTEKFDVVLDLEFFSNFTSIITALSGARTTVGFHTPKFWREGCYTKRVAFDHRHITEIFLKAARAVGIDADDVDLDPLLAAEGASASLGRVLATKGIASSERLVCININASSLDFKRRWPLESYRELIERILVEFPVFTLVLIGSGEESPYVRQLVGSLAPSRRLVDLCGAINLDELAELLQRSRLFIGNDSGPLHLAGAAGLPTVSFFGPETPALYGPRGPSHAVLYKNIPCSPCLNVYSSKDNSSCTNNVCMKSIGVEEAWKAVLPKLEEISAVQALHSAGGR